MLCYRSIVQLPKVLHPLASFENSAEQPNILNSLQGSVTPFRIIVMAIRYHVIEFGTLLKKNSIK